MTLSYCPLYFNQCSLENSSPYFSSPHTPPVARLPCRHKDMATTDELQSSGLTCKLLLPQLIQIWLPDSSAARQETTRSLLSEQAPRIQVPPLISFLEGLPDFTTPDNFKGKTFPCGHVVGLGWLISYCNLFADAAWTGGPQCLGCAQPDCDELLEFPKIPDPRVVDGLAARLDLIQWSWNKDAPTEHETHTVSLLRDILSRIGHVDQDPEPEPGAEPPRSEPSASSLTRTLLVLETEAATMAAHDRGHPAERGTEPYCSYRAFVEPAERRSRTPYPFPSPGQDCECVTPHDRERDPRSWASTPAETDSGPGEAARGERGRAKAVRFVAPVVTAVRYFEPWWCDEYRDSGRYWSTGPHRQSVDRSSAADDELEVERVEYREGVAGGMSVGMEGREDAVSDEEDEMGGAEDSWDEETLPDETGDDSSELHDLFEDMF